MICFSTRACVAALFLSCSAAQAQISVYNDQASFDAAVSTTAYDFEAYDDGSYQYVPGSLTLGPATFAGGDGDIMWLMSPGFVDGYGKTILSSQYGEGAFNISLGSGATAFGISFGSYTGGGPADVLVNGEFVTSVDIPNIWGSEIAFIGLISLQGITSIQINSHGSSVTLDAVGFETDAAVSAPPAPTPEADTWMMMIGGFGMVGATMRRRKVKAAFA
jgi:hypothetical protein